MALLTEGISVIIKDSELKRIPARYDSFILNLPNKTYNTDGKIHRLGFMQPISVYQFCDYLENVLGLRWCDEDNSAGDFVVVDMVKGLTTVCEWLHFRREKLFLNSTEFEMNAEVFSIVWMVNNYKGVRGNYSNYYSQNNDNDFALDGVSFPYGWNPDNALYSSDFSINPNEEFTVVKEDEITTALINKESLEVVHTSSPIINGETAEFFTFRKSAEEGNTEAQLRIGLMYLHGNEIKKDLNKAFYWVKKSAEQDNVLALYNLSVFYREGIGTAVNYKQEFDALLMSAEQGNKDAQYNLSKTYRFGSSQVEINTEKAIFWLEECAEQGDIDAMWELGDLLFKGEGGFQNKEKGLKLIQQSANLGCEAANLTLRTGRYKEEIKANNSKMNWIKRLFNNK